MFEFGLFRKTDIFNHRSLSSESFVHLRFVLLCLWSNEENEKELLPKAWSQKERVKGVCRSRGMGGGGGGGVCQEIKSGIMDSIP